MKKKRTALAVLGITAGILLAGCSQQAKDAEWKANENSVYVTRDGQVQSALVYSSEQFNELYKEEGLKAFAENAVAEYNAGPDQADGATEVKIGDAAEGAEEEKPPVTLMSCKLENQTGYLVFDYASPEDYLEFAKFSGDNTNTITGLTVAASDDAAAAGMLSGVGLMKPNGKEADIQDVLKSADYTIVSVEGAGTVCTEGKIAFVSAGETAVSLKDDFTAVTGEGTHYIIFK